MRVVTFIVIVFLFVSGCKKEDTLPQLSFSGEERKWFIYQKGQTFEFKNPAGDSVVFTVDSVSDSYRTEYRDPFTNPVEIGRAEIYTAYLKANDDFIDFTLYKRLLLPSDPERLLQSIAWHKVVGQLVDIANIENQTLFVSKTIHDITYTKVSAATGSSDAISPWTKWKSAYYDQDFGFIELIDMDGVSWIRE